MPQEVKIMKRIVIVGTLDTKGVEVRFIKELVENYGYKAIVIDVGMKNPPLIQADIKREEVAAVGGGNLNLEFPKLIEAMRKGVSKVVRRLYEKGELDGMLAIGGGMGTFIASKAMQTLPFGIPKLMVSTVASRDVSEYIGTSDITLMHSVIDFAGLNDVSKKLLSNAVGALIGMIESKHVSPLNKPFIGVTVFGYTTTSAFFIKELLEAKGYQMLAFHANGTGGSSLEEFISSGIIKGVIDLTTHEFIDNLYGGFCGNIKPNRLEEAGKKAVPIVVSPGGLDCVVMQSVERLPSKLKGRKIHQQDFRYVIRTNKEDMKYLARVIAFKLNKARGPVKVVIPLYGWSEVDREGKELYDPRTNMVFVKTLKKLLKPGIPVIEVEAHINDKKFAKAVVNSLNDMMKKARPR